jgi:hypothetical protein
MSGISSVSGGTSALAGLTETVPPKPGAKGVGSGGVSASSGGADKATTTTNAQGAVISVSTSGGGSDTTGKSAGSEHSIGLLDVTA